MAVLDILAYIDSHYDLSFHLLYSQNYLVVSEMPVLLHGVPVLVRSILVFR